jgi:hypothetical protein
MLILLLNNFLRFQFWEQIAINKSVILILVNKLWLIILTILENLLARYRYLNL